MLTQRKAVSMQAFFFIGYLVVGIVQLFAIMDGVAFATGFDGFVGFLIAIFTTYIPLGCHVGYLRSSKCMGLELFTGGIDFLLVYPRWYTIRDA